jgi:DNA-binding Xre family transcriptional regulator
MDTSQNDDSSGRVAACVVELLRDRGISHEDAADRTGIPYRTLRRRLANSGKPFDMNELGKVCGLLDLSIGALMTYADACEPVAS